MLKYLINRNNHSEYLVLLLNLLILRTVIPYLEYLFAVFGILCIPLLYLERHNLLPQYRQVNKFIMFLIPYLAVSLFFLFSFLFSKNYSFILIREFIVAIFFLFYLFFSLLLLKSNNQLDQYIFSFKKQFIIITSLAAVFGIIKFILEVLGIQFSFLISNGLYPAGSSLKADHNFYSLSILIGFLFVLERISEKSKNTLLYNLLLVLYMVNVLLSSSRRGIILLILLNAAILILWMFNHRMRLLKVHKLRIYFLVIPIVGIALSACIYFYGNYNRNASLDFKNKTASILSDYRSIFNKNRDYAETYNLLWKSDFATDWRNYNVTINNESIISLIPEPGICSLSQTINNLELIPGWQHWMSLRTEEILIDSIKLLRVEGFHPWACLYRFIEIDTLASTLYVSMNIKVEKWNELEKVELHWNNKSISVPLPNKFNDGKWHNLKFKSSTDSAEIVQMSLYFTGRSMFDYGGILLCDLSISTDPIGEKFNESYLNNLNQLLIPARMPIYSDRKQIYIDTIDWKTEGEILMDTLIEIPPVILYTYSDSSAGYIYKDVIIPKSQFWEFSSHVTVFHAAENLRIDIRNLSTGNYIKGVYPPSLLENDSLYSWERLHAYFYAEKGDTVRVSLKVYDDTIPQLVFWKKIILGSYNGEDDKVLDDTLRRINVQSIFRKIENSKLQNDELHINSESAKVEYSLIGPRIVRWKYALELYSDYTVLEKIFGSGFDYIEKFRRRFSETKEFDYPHNIFLSVLLYSGIFGFILFLCLIFDTIRIYFKSRLYVLLIAYIFILSFVFFSSDSIFELPLLMGFIVIPYIFQVVKLKTNS